MYYYNTIIMIIVFYKHTIILIIVFYKHTIIMIIKFLESLEPRGGDLKDFSGNPWKLQKCPGA